MRYKTKHHPFFQCSLSQNVALFCVQPHGPEAEDEYPMRYYIHAADDPEPGEVVRFHVPPNPEAGGYTGWVRECVQTVMGKREPPISNAHSAR